MSDRRPPPDPKTSPGRPRVSSTTGPTTDPAVESDEFARPLRRNSMNVVPSTAVPPAAPVPTAPMVTPPSSPARSPMSAAPFAPAMAPSLAPAMAPALTPASGWAAQGPLTAETSVGPLELTPVDSPSSTSDAWPAPPSPAVTVPTSAPLLTNEMASALAGLKRARPTTMPGDPPARIPSSPGPAPARIPTDPGADLARALAADEPASTPRRATAAPGSMVMLDVASVGRGISTRTLAVVGAVVGALFVVGGGVAFVGAGPDLPVPKLPDTAVRCSGLSARGTDLVCTATTTSLNGLLPRERRDRLAATLPVVRGAGFARVVFEDDGRVWRIENVDGSP